MVAGVLRRLGVPLGETIDAANNEDQAFLGHGGRRAVFEADDLRRERAAYIEGIHGIIDRRDRTHDVWGWKDPLASFYVPDIADRLRNPVFIVVTRDPGAVAQRETVEEGTGAPARLLAHLSVALDTYRRCLDVVLRLERPTLLVSYERALRYPRAVGRSVAAMIGVEAPAGLGDWLDDYVRADRPDGSVDRAAGRSFWPQTAAATSAIESVLEESARVRRQGLFPEEIGGLGDRDAAAAALYTASTTALLEGRYDRGEQRALELVALYSARFPELADGPLGVLTHEAGAVGPLLYPDILCAAFYIVGLAALLAASASRGMLYLKLAEALMWQRLHVAPQASVLSLANYGSCAFHLALSATAMRRPDVAAHAARNLFGAAAIFGPAGEADFGTWISRLQAEVLQTAAPASSEVAPGATVAAPVPA